MSHLWFVGTGIAGVVGLGLVLLTCFGNLAHRLREHSWWRKYVRLLAIGGLLWTLALSMLALYASRHLVNASASRPEVLQRGITSLRLEIQQALDEQDERSLEFTNWLAHDIAMPWEPIPLDDRIHQLASQLTRHLDARDQARVIPSDHRSADSSISIARAVLANVRKQPDKAIAILTDIEAHHPSISKDEELQLALLHARGDAHRALRQNENAGRCYALILQFQPRDLAAATKQVKSYSYLVQEDGNARHHEALARALRQRARTLMLRGSSADALLCYRKAIRVNETLYQQSSRQHILKEWVDCLVAYGRLLLEQGYNSDAIAPFSKAIDNLSQAGLSQDDTDMAVQFAVCYYHRGLAQRDLGALPEALNDLNTAAYKWTMFHGQESDLKILERLGACMHDRAGIHLDQGDLASAKRDLNDAIRIRRIIVARRKHPRDGEQLAMSHFNRGEVRRHQGQLSGAFEDYDRAVRLLQFVEQLPGGSRSLAVVVEALNNRGSLFAIQGRVSLAKDDFDRAIAVCHSVAERARSARLLRGLALAHCNRGNAYTELGEPARALADYDRAADFLHLLSVRNPDPTLRSYLATCLSRRASVLVHFGKLTQSLDDMDLVVDLRTRELQRETSSNTAHELGMSLVHRAEVHQLFGDQAASYDDYNKGVETYRRYCQNVQRIDILTSYAAALEGRARMLLNKGLHEYALTDFKDAIEMCQWLHGQHLPESAEQLAQVLSGCALLQSASFDVNVRKTEDAVTNAFRACELTGWENTECLAALAAAQASKGDFRNAIRWQKQALELAGSEGAHAHRLRLELYERNEPYRLPMTPDASNTD